MTDTADKRPQAAITQQQAEELARRLNIALNNVSFYGAAHPNTVGAARDFVALLSPIHRQTPMLVLLRAHDSLYLDQWCVDKRINIQRILPVLKRTGIESVAFERGLEAEEFGAFVESVGNYQSHGTADAMRRHLRQQGVRHLRINYVSYKKVTEDEEVVDRDALKQNAASGHVMGDVAELFSLKQLLQRPGELAGYLTRTAVEGGEESQVMRHLRELRGRIDEGGKAEGATVQQLMKAVYCLKTELREGLAVQRELGKIARNEGSLLDEVNQMSCRVLVELVIEEYRAGSVSPKRLAQIVRRMLPDIHDLKGLLPELKRRLLAEGMSLADYLALVRELHKELQSDQLSRSLIEGAEQVGMSPEEIADCVRDNPDEAARLIVLASEVRRGATPEGSGLPELLSDYVERISGILALQSPPAEGDGRRVLNQLLYKLEKELVAKLKVQGVPDGVLETVEKRLAGRFQSALAKVKSEWLARFLDTEGELTGTHLLRLLEDIVDQETDLAAMHDPLRQVLTRKGFSAGDIERFYERMARHVAARKETRPLPKGVLSANNTMFFLQRQVKRHLRYEHPFSCLMATPVTVQNGARREPPAEEHLPSLVTQTYSRLRTMLRDLDIVGTLGTLAPGIPFVILPVTDRPGAEAVHKRIDADLGRKPYKLGQSEARVHFVLTSMSYDRRTTPGLDSFIAELGRRHREEVMKNAGC